MANEVTVHVKAEDRTDMNVIGRKVEAKAKASFAKTGGHAGAAFSAGFIKVVTLGMVGGGWAKSATRLSPSFAHAGGVLGAALAGALVLKAASAIGALLPAALGGALVAGPLIYLWKTQEKAVDRLKKKAKSFMDTISRPFKVPFLDALKTVGAKLDEWGPKLKRALKPLAGELGGGVKGALKAIENFAKEIDMDKITAGFKEWGKQLPKIGRALGRMLDSWMEDAPGTQESVDDLANSFVDLADSVGKLGRMFRGTNKFLRQWDNFNGDNFTKFGVSLKNGGKAWLFWKAKALHAVDGVIGAMAKLDPAMRGPAKAVHKMRVQADRELDKLQTKFQRTKIEANIKADKRDLERKVKDSKARLDFLKKQKPTPQVRAEIAQLKRAVAQAKAALASIRDKHVTIYTTRQISASTNSGGRASGGYVGGEHAQAATGGARGGRVLVGEYGPELVDLPFGSHVNSNADSQRMMSSGGKGGITINIMAPNYVGAPADLLRALVDAKRRGQLDVILR